MMGAAAAGAIVLAGPESLLLANVTVLRVLLVYFLVLYADYIVIADVGRTATSPAPNSARLLPSVTVLLVVTLLGSAATSLLNESVTGSLARALPMLVVLMGGVVFIADVVLVVLYLTT